MKLSLIDCTTTDINDSLTDNRKSLSKRKFKATKEDTFRQPKRQPYKREKYKNW